MELRPFDDSHYALLSLLEEQDDVWESVGRRLLPEEGNHLFAITEGSVALGIGGLVKSQVLDGKDFEVVCALRSEAQAQGLALRASQLLLAWAFDTAKLDRVIACVDDDNEAGRSIALKIGMRELCPLPPGRTVYVKDRRAAAVPR